MNSLLKSRFAIAVLMVSILSALYAVSQRNSSLPEFPYLSWSGWTIKDFLAQRARANIVFLGSSLVLVPLDGVDANFLQKKIDGSQHHHSAYFEKRFQEKSGLEAKSFTFALPGEMPSDAYLIVKNLLNGAKRPELIIYGVGPRDFLDNLLPSPSATDPFSCLSRFGDITPQAARFMPQWQERLSFELGKVFFIFGAKNQITDKLTKTVTLVLPSLLPLPAKQISFDDRRLLLPEYRPCEVGKGQAFFRPTAGQEPFVDNLAEYKKRYATMNWDTYLTQMHFFADMLNCAQSKGIKVVVVAMPITGLNRALLSNLSWDAYRKGVIAMARRKGAYLVDFSEDKNFSQADFGDTVHLHAHGGKRFLDLLVDRLSGSTYVLSALKNETVAGLGRTPL